VDDRRHTNPTRFSDPLQSGRDINAIAVDVVVLRDDYVAEVDADPEYDLLFLRRPRIAVNHPPLHRNRTGYGLNDTGKLYENAVAGRFDDAALMFGDLRVDQFTAMGSEPGKSASLVLAHQSRVSDDIGGENGRESAFDPLSAQCFLPAATRREFEPPYNWSPFSVRLRRKPINRAEPCRTTHQTWQPGCNPDGLPGQPICIEGTTGAILMAVEPRSTMPEGREASRNS
jgi:hypothetical protein